MNISIPNVFKSFSRLETILLVVFILYIVLPIQTPNFLAGAIDSSLGMLSIFIITVYLFFHVNPILAVVYIFVAYELLRRSCKITGQTPIVEYTPTQVKKDQYMKEMNPPTHVVSLEEEIIHQMAPIGKSDPTTYIDTSYKPIADKLMEGATLV